MAELLTRTLPAPKHAQTGALDALVWPEGGGQQQQFYFRVGTKADDIIAPEGVEVTDIRSIGNGLQVWAKAGPDAALCLPVKGAPKADPSPLEHDLFEGLNIILATRNGESPETVAEWLAFHARHQGMQAALIIDRALPGKAKTFAKKLKRIVKGNQDLTRVVMFSSPVPLGLEDLPPESHPINAPAAPGKDRMTVPQPSPWDSPFGEVVLYELLRHRFLAKARAVANVDVFDLIPDQGISIFDRAVNARNGAILLAGRHIYPWRVRPDERTRFGDHICVQFDNRKGKRRWCVAPGKANPKSVWRLIRVVGAEPVAEDTALFYRAMALRHPTENVSTIVPKTSLIEDADLVKFAKETLGNDPVRVPAEALDKRGENDTRTAIVTCMKNEGPFILEWLAYHRAIGVEDFLVYTNDCTDGTDTFLDLLQDKGLVQHRENPFKGTDLKPQHAALAAADKEEVITEAAWVISMDVDEYINIKVGDGTLAALYATVPDANMISCTWRLFGNSDIHDYRDEFLTEKFTRCAQEFANKPHQAWGFKTLYKQLGIFKKLGVHRPKGLKPQLKGHINWVNGSGNRMPESEFRNAWRSTAQTYGYDMVQLNHYAVRSAESFLVKRDRGRVNHVDRDQGLAYWFRMNNNGVEDTSIQRMIPRLREEYDRLLQDPEIRAQHEACVAAHRAKIDELKATQNYAKFFAELTGERMEKLSKLHRHFGANVFLAGPEVVPDDVVNGDHPENFFFTVERQATAH